MDPTSITLLVIGSIATCLVLFRIFRKRENDSVSKYCMKSACFDEPYIRDDSSTSRNESKLNLEDLDILTITDESGDEIDFYFLGEIEYCDKSYLVLTPADNDDDEAEIFFFEDSNEDGENFVCEVEDEELYDKLFEIWEEMIEE